MATASVSTRAPPGGLDSPAASLQHVEHARRASPSAAARAARARRRRLAAAARPGRARRRASAARSSCRRSSARQRPCSTYTRARDSSALIDLERRILGGRADEGQRAVLDIRQKGVLLRLVEAMHLIEKQHASAARRRAALRACSTTARMSLMPAMHRRERDELRVGAPARPAAPAWSCRCPADPTESSNAAARQRSRRSGLPGRRAGGAGRRTLEGLRAQPIGQRSVACRRRPSLARRVRSRRPPRGGVKLNSGPAPTCALRSMLREDELA